MNEELDRISSTTQFNKQDLLTGKFSGKLQVGALEGQTMDLKISTAVSSTELKVKDIKVSTNENAGKAMKSIQDAIESVSKQRSKLGAIQNRLEHTINNLDTNAENTQAAESRIRDTDMLMRWYSTARITFFHRLDSLCLHRLISRHRVYFHFSVNNYYYYKQKSWCLHQLFLFIAV